MRQPEEPTARVTIDARGILKAWNEGARRLLGHRPGQIVGHPAAELLADPATAPSLAGLAGLTRWNGTLTLLREDGAETAVRLLAHRLTGDDGATEWLVVSPGSADATPTPGSAEAPATAGDEAPESYEEMAEQSFRQSPCTMAIYDGSLRLRGLNQDMERVLGLTVDEVYGLRLPDMVPGADSEIVQRSMRQVLRTGVRRHHESAVRLEGYEHVSAWSVFLAPLRDTAGRVWGVILSAHDMTVQHTAQRRLLLVNEASTRIGASLDLVSTARELVAVTVPDFADFVTVDLLPAVVGGVDEPSPGPLSGHVVLRRVACRSVLEGSPEAVVQVGGTAFYPDASPAAECLITERGILHQVTDPGVNRWAAQAPDRAASMRRFGFHSTMAVPLRARGTTLGVATFSRHRSPDPFEQDDLLLAEEITARAAVCIDNARRYTRERETALTLQRSLLPKVLPEHAAVEAAFRYLPADSGAGVGGDWFDVIPLSGARVALVVGDVVGHGVQASATMGRLRTAVRTLADVDLPPDELLTHLDDLVNHLSMEAMGRPGRSARPSGRRTDGEARGESAGSGAESAGDVGATCLYAVYDPVSRHCSAARAGHPPPAVVSPDGTVEFLDVPAGPPLGLGGLPFETVETELAEGSLLALYTNGLVESRERGGDESTAALRAALARPAEPLEDICDAVLKALLLDRQTDDVALLLARTRALDAHQVVTWELPSDPAVVARVRRDVSAQLTAWGLEEAVFTTELLVSELVTNAIRYAEAPIQLRLIHHHSLICEVSDGSNTAPHLRRARVFDEGGRGLLLVAQLTQSWGTRQGGVGKTIWAEQTLPVVERTFSMGE
ncbi:SpoIIE family protein phosphatase [Streptomyces sp. NPDC087850]|uniref:SpoIIE family protein phosphatase n=1 Tax=Streptomyces sp. NPDC087850 TaxID=3365809 RepID=UPI003827EB77